MTILEFEAWVSDNYSELIAKAAKISQSRDGRHIDLLHDSVEHILEDPDTRLPSGDPFAFLYVAMERRLLDLRTTEANRGGREEAAASGLSVLEEDAFINTERAKRAARKRAARAAVAKNGPAEIVEVKDLNKDQRYRAKKKAEKTEGLISDWLTGPCGNIRWRSQQLRDGRLFDERAVRSLADSMHRTSERCRHGEQAGLAFGEYGPEAYGPDDSLTATINGLDVFGPGVPLAARIPLGRAGAHGLRWTRVSSSTGQSNKQRKGVWIEPPSPHDVCDGCIGHAIRGQHDKACALKGVSPMTMIQYAGWEVPVSETPETFRARVYANRAGAVAQLKPDAGVPISQMGPLVCENCKPAMSCIHTFGKRRAA